MQTYTISFFAYLMPYGTLVLIITFFLELYIDKWKLFFRSSLKDDFNYEMTRIASKLFMSSVWIYAMGNFIFGIAFTRQLTWYSVISLSAATIFMIYLWLLPNSWEFIILDKIMRYEAENYDLCKQTNKFQHTYRNQNPASKLASTSCSKRALNWFALPEDQPIIQNLQKSKVK
jgi:hypothetical protein